MDLDGGSAGLEAFTPCHILSQISSFVDSSVNHSRHLCNPGTNAIQESFSCLSKFAGAVLLWFGSGSNSNISQKLQRNCNGSNMKNSECSAIANRITSNRCDIPGFCFKSRLRVPGVPVSFINFSRVAVRQLLGDARKLQFLPALSLAGAFVPPLDNFSQNVLAVPPENDVNFAQNLVDQCPCEVSHWGCGDLSYGKLACSGHAVEPRTGIQFPTLLDNVFGETSPGFSSEVLVGTGSRIMKIIKIKSLKVYAFGFYVHPHDVCEKLGWKYSSIPASEVNKHESFYSDLLREDISMTVRLVVSCNGIKINAIRNAFEKSLRARLMKTNPDTDYDCVRRFGSLFSQDIPLPAGTTIDFRRTADGHLVTKIGGNQIGAVCSKDLCRAFFDMYIGDVPVSEQTKGEIGRNIVSIMRRC